MNKRLGLRFGLFIVLLLIKLTAICIEPVLIKDGKVREIVLDKETNAAVEYATIALYQSPDKKLITGTISDFNGHFKIDNIEFGTYYLVVSFIGYEEIVTDESPLPGDEGVGPLPARRGKPPR